MSPEVSPDGRWLAFRSGNQEDIYVVGVDGNQLRQVTNDAYMDRAPRWSPDAKRIAFYSSRSGTSQIWVMRPDGGAPEQLTQEPGSKLYPVWSPDGKRLAYSQNGVRSMIMDLATPRAPHQALPDVPQPDVWFAAWSWSPDGRKLAGFLQHTDGRLLGISVYSLDTQTYQQLTHSGSHPVWLNDSRRLLFQSGPEPLHVHGGAIATLIDTQSKRVKEILSLAPNYVGDGFRISPDNRTIYYGLGVREADIWLMKLE